MSEMAKIQQIGETDAREVINRWSAGGYFRIRNFGDKIFLQEIATTASYHLRLRTHYEERSVEQAQKPYHGGPIDDDGHPPGIWDIHVERPREFEERQEVLPLPHTERVQLCPQCAGVGRVGCAKCLGSGKTTCPFCTGAGFLQRQEMVPGGGTNNQGGPLMRTVQTPCTCLNGRVRCTACAGNGRITCSTCSGAGKITTFEQINVRFYSNNKLNVVDETPVPDNLIGKLHGEVMLDEKSAYIESLPPLAPEIDAKIEAMLQVSHEKDENHARILLQSIHVEQVPVHEVRYSYAGVDRKLWICGQENLVYAPGTPWNRGRLAMLGGILAGFMIAAGVAVWFFLLR